jgi:glucose dehydrogenase
MNKLAVTTLAVVISALITVIVAAQAPPQSAAAPRAFTPVTQKMLENPSPADRLMFSRTYDAQRFNPLKQITKQNVTEAERRTAS